MDNAQSGNYLGMPDNLPAPEDDGAADHLLGMKISDLLLPATSGEQINLSKLPAVTVLFCYPMSGVPGVALPEGWDDIPGARGCTPQACSYRDKYPELMQYASQLFGLSTQTSAYQAELKNRVQLPYELLSDSNLQLQKGLSLPTFFANNATLLKRLTLIIKDGVISKVHYPVFPSDKDVDWVLAQLAQSN
jgi:peroxiredoxin